MGDEFYYSEDPGRAVVTEEIGDLFTVTYYDSAGDLIRWQDYIKDKSGAKLKNLVPNDPGISARYFEPPLPFSPWTNLVGDTLLFASAEIRGDSLNSHLKILVEYEIAAIEEVTTPAGKFGNCIKVKSIYKTLDDIRGATFDGESFWWFAKNVGLIKYTTAGDTCELIRASVGGINYP
jgi:hypothetical protein